ncbi:molybdenum cofactor guanylyltransferase [Streptacidiphilus sp. NEAU-YB345]|uniref:Molybdenum cofactor guanylyltransferase n=1 Tax=Streptacidiphilus fuscans TaxID=2789292 RepID=A0A931FB25_9ACTN|nr:molybdenum cofactor guanylyltransferase [Streptacidiphilus fuscans]
MRQSEGVASPALPLFDAVVLAGGAARRLGGEDKPGLVVGGASLLDRVLAACAAAQRTVVVGPERPTARPVRWTRETPPGGGPVAGLAAGMESVTAEVVVLLAADLPFLDAPTVHALVAALDPHVDADRDVGAGAGAGADGVLLDGVVLVDADGRDQPLAAAYRTAVLRAKLAQLPSPEGAPLRALTRDLHLLRLPDTRHAAVDCDTWDDVHEARLRADRMDGAPHTPPSPR